MLREMARRTSSRPAGQSARPAREPDPPYLKAAHDVIWVGFRIDIDAVRPFVPPELKLNGDSTGILGIYQAGSGWGLAPYQRGLVAVTVSGTEGGGTGDGIFNLSGIMTAPAVDIVRRRYTKDVVEGYARSWRDGDLVHGVAGVGSNDWLRASIRPSPSVKTGMSGVDTFMGMTSRGLLKHADSFEADIADAEIVSLEITDAAPPAMQAMRPLEWLFAIHVPRLSSSWGEPRPIGQTDDAVGFYLDLVEGTGRAAVAVSMDGRLLKANGLARELLGGDCLRPGEPMMPQHTALWAAIERSRSAGRPRISDPVVLSRTDQAPIIAYTLPFDAHGGGDTQLVLFTRADAPARQDASRLLQMMGLTQAEARLGALIGGGLSAKQAAAELSISENTARSTLKSVYDKLGIGKQAELGHLVARLEFL